MLRSYVLRSIAYVIFTFLGTSIDETPTAIGVPNVSRIRKCALYVYFYVVYILSVSFAFLVLAGSA